MQVRLWQLDTPSRNQLCNKLQGMFLISTERTIRLVHLHNSQSQHIYINKIWYNIFSVSQFFSVNDNFDAAHIPSMQIIVNQVLFLAESVHVSQSVICPCNLAEMCYTRPRKRLDFGYKSSLTQELK